MESPHLHDHTYRAEALKSINADKKISVDLEQISCYLSINVNNSIYWRILKSHSEVIILRGNFNRI